MCLDQARLQTWDPVSVHCRGWPVRVFQKRMQRSAVPPPDASRPCWWGDQAIAFTAAKCSVYCWTGTTLEWFHTSNCRATFQMRRSETSLWLNLNKQKFTLYLPCYHFLLRPAADGLCSTWAHRLPACVLGDGVLTGEAGLWCPAAGSRDHDSQTTAGLHSMPRHLAKGGERQIEGQMIHRTWITGVNNPTRQHEWRMKSFKSLNQFPLTHSGSVSF